MTGCLDRTGERPGAYLERIGLLSDRLVLAHGVWMDDPELELVANAGSTVVTNPVSNLKLAVGRIFPYARVRAHGIPVALGTDGASSNNSLDLLDDVKVLALIQKFGADDPAALPAAEAWAVATGAEAPLLWGPTTPTSASATGRLLPRAPRRARARARARARQRRVRRQRASVVRTTVVGGRVLMRDGVIEGDDEVRHAGRRVRTPPRRRLIPVQARSRFNRAPRPRRP